MQNIWTDEFINQLNKMLQATLFNNRKTEIFSKSSQNIYRNLNKNKRDWSLLENEQQFGGGEKNGGKR